METSALLHAALLLGYLAGDALTDWHWRRRWERLERAACHHARGHGYWRARAERLERQLREEDGADWWKTGGREP